MSFDLEPRMEPVPKEKATNWGAIIGGFAVAFVITFLVMTMGKTPDTAGIQPTNTQSSGMASAPIAQPAKPAETTGSATQSQ